MSLVPRAVTFVRRCWRRESKIDRALRLLDLLTKAMTDMNTSLDQIKSDVAANTDVVGSAVTLLGSLSDKLKAAIDDAKQNAGSFAALDDLHAQLVSNNKALSDAVAANTPAASVPTAPATEPAPAEPGA